MGSIRFKWLVFSVLLVTFRPASGQDQMTYIRSYQDIAIAEMLRTGIPASIKLAQAMHESNCGKSELAHRANNHFGIKCGGNWQGKSFHKEDDDYENGMLVKSCFRHFSSVTESYIAHSDFLTDPSRTVRYGHLFRLDITDYKGWASGLARAGYATDPQYAAKLVAIIEKYELFRFDHEYKHEPALATAPPSPAAVYELLLYNNDVRYVAAREGDNPMIIAGRQDMNVRQLIKYNDDIYTAEQALVKGTKVYLQPKRAAYHGKQKFHTLKEGEDMVSLSQHYGIKLDALLKRNGLAEGEVPLPRQQIALKGKNKNKLRTTRGIQYLPQPGTPRQVEVKAEAKTEAYESQLPDTLILQPSNAATPQLAQPSQRPQPLNPSTPNPEQPGTKHTVSKGETLYSIARTYGLTVDELKKMNTLSADTIIIGQTLVLR